MCDFLKNCINCFKKNQYTNLSVPLNIHYCYTCRKYFNN